LHLLQESDPQVFNDNPQTYPQVLWIRETGFDRPRDAMADSRKETVAARRQAATVFALRHRLAAARGFG
jgi:hypothetical protein